MNKKVNIHDSWYEVLADEFTKPYFTELVSFVKQEYASQTIYPDGKNIFRAFDLCPFDKVRVVIIGQDPYHGEGQAHGLCFSVKDGTTLPPSLVNIFKEMYADLGKEIPKSGDLSYLAQQGVLLLNATLTVRKNQAGSHQNRGWETFTDAVIARLSKKKRDLVFLLWGSYAQKKGQIIDKENHFVLESAHPSPFSVYRGFYGNKHFSKTNEYLISKNLSPINW